MKRLLYQVHRWVGVALALFMLMWFSSGLSIMYAGPSALGPEQLLAGRDAVNPQPGWLSLGEAWTRSAAQRAQLPAGKAEAARPDGSDRIVRARLVRQADRPLWLVEDTQGRRLALSAIDGSLHQTSALEAQEVATRWVATTAGQAESASGLSTPSIWYLDTGDQDSSLRNLEALRPFHRFAVSQSSRELVVSARTGEVVRDTTRLERTMYWVGNWLHLLRPLESVGFGSVRRDVLTWLTGFAFAGSLTGLIIGWQRWRPGWGGRPTYSQGRTHPYRDAWTRWHFWAGLIGGTAALLWAFSGFINNNPWQLFSPATPSRAEINRYLGNSVPQQMLDWRPGVLASDAALSAGESPIVELAWNRLGEQAVLTGLTRHALRITMPTADPPATGFSTATLRAAAQRLAGATPLAGQALQTSYDSQYYPRHHQGALDKPLPVLTVDLADAAGTRLYLDPQDGRLVARLDNSRRVYRWLYSAIHHWDFGWLYSRPAWDGWMLSLVGLGLVLAGSSVVLGWKRLRRTAAAAWPAQRPGSTASAPARTLTRASQTH